VQINGNAVSRKQREKRMIDTATQTGNELFEKTITNRIGFGAWHGFMG
jgi:hypothetical protein